MWNLKRNRKEKGRGRGGEVWRSGNVKEKGNFVSWGLRTVNFSNFVPALSKIPYVAFDSWINYSIR